MKPATDWTETVPPGEDDRLLRHAEALRDIQRRRAAKTGKVQRALHAKGLAGLEGEVTVLPGLPEYARVGLFASPASYRAYVRFSSGSGLLQHDKKPDVRGVALKLLGVPGKKIIPGLADATTQDFLLITSPATPFRNPDEFVALVRATEHPALALPRLIRALGLRRTFALVRQLAGSLGAPMGSLATTPFYSALPVKYGPYAIHYNLAPQARPGPAGAPYASSDRASRTSPHHLGEELAERLRRGPVTYDLRVQFYVDARRTPIEDASVEWQEQDAPFLTVARLTLPQQDPTSPRGLRVAALCEGLSFDPWHATEDFRPLGDMMRARNHAYRLSTQERAALPEPTAPISSRRGSVILRDARERPATDHAAEAGQGIPDLASSGILHPQRVGSPTARACSADYPLNERVKNR